MDTAEPTGTNPDNPPAPKSERLELRKPHEMIVLIPRAKRVTLTGRRIYNAMLQVAQGRLRALPEMPPADFMFEAPLPALLRTTGSSGEDRTAAKRYLREMRGMEVDWESTTTGDGIKWQGFSMLSEVVIELRNGENWVRWSYPPTLMSALKQPQLWARIDLDVVAKLGTYSALALYEICARYRGNPSGMTSRKPVQWWADALSGTPPGAERREWRKFKNERVKEAVAAINEETDLEIALIEHRQGRAVEEVQFSVRERRSTGTRPRLVGQVPVDANLVLRAESLGVRELKLESLIKEFGEAAVRDKVDALERRTANRQLTAVDNAFSYLRSLLRNSVGDDVPETVPSVAALPSAPAALSPQAMEPQARLPVREAVPAAAPSAHEAQLLARIAGIKSEILALDPPQRQVWVDAALADLAANRLLSAVISRRAAQGDVMHGVLGSVIVRLYATARYGEDWNRLPADPG
jgi:hypothetical protein